MAYVDLSFEVNVGQVLQPFSRDILGFVPGSLFITANGENVRFFYGGTAPTATNGHPLYAGASLAFMKTPEIENLKITAVAGTATVFATVGGT